VPNLCATGNRLTAKIAGEPIEDTVSFVALADGLPRGVTDPAGVWTSNRLGLSRAAENQWAAEN